MIALSDHGPKAEACCEQAACPGTVYRYQVRGPLGRQDRGQWPPFLARPDWAGFLRPIRTCPKRGQGSAGLRREKICNRSFETGQELGPEHVLELEENARVVAAVA